MPESIDGDTLVVADRIVRPFGADAPEVGQSCVIGRRWFDCGTEARTALLDLSAGMAVICGLVPDTMK